MKNRDLIRDAMMFAVKDITGRVLREATVQSMIDDFEKQLNIPVVSGMFSEEQMEQAWTDGAGCGETRSGFFDIENYR